MVSLVVTQNEYHTSLLVPFLSVFLCSIQLVLFCYQFYFPSSIYLSQVSNENARNARCEIFSQLSIKTPENVIDVNLVSSLLTLCIFLAFF